MSMPKIIREERAISGDNAAGVHTTALVGIEIDVEALFRLLGRRAIANKTGKAAVLGGIVKAQAYAQRKMQRP